MRPFEACPFCNGEFMFDWINDTRRCNNCGALFTWRIIREPSGVPIDLTLQLKKAEDRITELKAENDELKERVAMLDVNSVFKSLGEMKYIGQVANLEAENAMLQARIAELEAERLELRKTLGWAYDLDEYKDNPEVQKMYNKFNQNHRSKNERQILQER